MEKPERYQQHYSEAGFWAKLASSALVAGRGAVQQALTLYFAARSPNTPTWAKTLIFGALGYFILPLDAIPDFVPLAGFTDDIGMLSAAALAVATFMTSQNRQQAEETLTKWFGGQPAAEPAGTIIDADVRRDSAS